MASKSFGSRAPLDSNVAPVLYPACLDVGLPPTGLVCPRYISIALFACLAIYHLCTYGALSFERCSRIALFEFGSCSTTLQFISMYIFKDGCPSA